MATTTRILDANVNGTVYTSNANAALEALDTCHSGATAPTDEVANGKLWLDTTTTPGILKIYNNATWEVVHSGTVDINGGTIDGTVIGGATPTDITGTTLTATGAFTSLGIDDNAASTAVTIDASGNVGIGTASPDKPLEVVATNTAMKISGVGFSSTGLLFETNGVERKKIGIPSGSSDLAFYSDAGSSEAMRIDASGTVLVGTTSAGFTTTAGTVCGGSYLAVTRNNDTALFLGRLSGDGSVALFRRDSTVVGGISVTGSATAYVTSSDYRLKENITPVQGAADIVKAMQPVTYTFKSDGSWHDGFLAHELQELHPRAVIGEKDAMQDEEYEVTSAVLDEDGAVVTEAVMGTRSVPDYQGVDYSKLTPILTAALQEALNKIDALEVRIAALEP